MIVEDRWKIQNEEMVRIHHDLNKAESELVTKQAALDFVRGISGPISDTNKVATADRIQRADDYKELLKELGMLRERHRELSRRYTDESHTVRYHAAKINDLLEKKKILEAQDPQLTALTFQTVSGDKPSVSPTETLSQIASLNALVNNLSKQLTNTLARLEQLEKIAPDIKELERRRD